MERKRDYPCKQPFHTQSLMSSSLFWVTQAVLLNSPRRHTVTAPDVFTPAITSFGTSLLNRGAALGLGDLQHMQPPASPPQARGFFGGATWFWGQRLFVSAFQQPPASTQKRAGPWKYLTAEERAVLTSPSSQGVGVPRTHHSPLPFPLPPRSARLPKPEETGGKSWLLPTVNTEKGRVAFGMKGGGSGQQDTTRPNAPPALPQLPPAPAEPVPSLRGCFGLREPPLHDAPPLLISLTAQEQRQGL